MSLLCRTFGCNRGWPDMELCDQCGRHMSLDEVEPRRFWWRRMLGAMLAAAVICVLLLWVGRADAAPPVSDAGQQLIVRFEVGGRAAYDARYQRPICPACLSTASGVTIGIGYDLRHQSVANIRRDWGGHPQLERMVAAQGLGGAQAAARAREMRDVVVTWPQANAVFRERTLPQYDAIARRAFGPAYDAAPQSVRDALVSVVYNRGGSTVGPARAEFRAIRDRCLPAGVATCTAGQIRAMTRLWVGTPIEAGMTRRRYAEAAHAAP